MNDDEIGSNSVKEKEEEEEEEARCEWDFRLRSVVPPSSATTAAAGTSVSDALGATEIDPSRQFLATAGIARKIRVYKLPAVLAGGDEKDDGETTAGVRCELCVCAPAKVSSLKFRPDAGGRIVAAGDYDGVVTEYDLELLTAVAEVDEHGGRRVWSVDYSHLTPSLAASAADDGVVRLWDARSGGHVASASPSVASSACCAVEFGVNDHQIAVGCADRAAYLYDARAIAAGPVAALRGHSRPVTYVRFAGKEKVVTSATDGTHRLWMVGDGGRTLRTYGGHVNSRSFIGMSVWTAGGLIASGSETSEVYVYDFRWAGPIWLGRFGLDRPVRSDRGFVSSVCWRDGGPDDGGVLVAGGSDGGLHVFTALQKAATVAGDSKSN